ncbi:hypothetical protein ALO97_200083 [Pseudomonas syringae pv. tagetis]|nr:hypothetical protein ALO98_200092 [Pseudomonas syringae pv. tagetis]RMW24986.1 hypothetical protein ALO97_200083 [Pseudomonas syringae pv. tagetis]
MTASILFVCFSRCWASYRSTASAVANCACNGGLFDPNARRSVRRCGGAGISRCIVKACATERHCASSPGSTRTFSRTTKNPPKRVFPRPSRLPVGCLRDDGRSSLILVNSCSPLDGSNTTEDGPSRKWPNPSIACKCLAIPCRRGSDCTPALPPASTLHPHTALPSPPTPYQHSAAPPKACAVRAAT